MNKDSNGSYKWVILLITSIGSFMSPMDGSIVSVSLPAITMDLNMTYAMAIWVPTAYLATLTVLLLSIGRHSDIKGRKPFFIAGFAVFTFASFLCSISTDGLQLITFRIIQGIGAAFMAATSTAIVTDVFPGKERGKALGINVMAVYVGLAAGPSLGGFLTSAFGWRSIFLINIPIGIFVIAMALWKLKDPFKTSQKSFDLSGALSFSLGIIPLLLALTLGGIIGWDAPLVVGLLIACVAFLVLFVFLERNKKDQAMLDVTIFTRNRQFSAANIAALLNYTAFFGVSFFISFYLQRALSYTPVEAGVILFIMPVTMAILSPLSGWLSDKVGARGLASLGMVIITIGLLLLSALNLNSSAADVSFRLLIIGLGMGLFSSPNTSAVMGAVEKNQLGVASGTIGTMRFLGQSLSIAIMSAVFATFLSSSVLSALFVGVDPATLGVATEEFIVAMQAAFIIGAIIAAVGAVFSLIRGKTNNKN
jgi:EmrB/QacA subfamily drug resistance transporter